MTEIKEVTAIILNTSKPEKVLENVRGILRQKTDFELQVIVVDNSGLEKNRNILDPLKNKNNVTVFYTTNNGYSAGNNLGAKKALGEVIFLINPDIIIPHADTFQRMADYLRNHKSIGIMGPRQKNPDGSLEYTARRFPTLPAQLLRRTFLKHIWPFSTVVRKYEYTDLNTDVIQDVDWLQSSFWAIRRDLWNEMNGLDEDYFVFMSDVEMCLQTWKKNKRVVYFPDVEVYADGFRCSEGGLLDLFTKKIMRIHASDAIRYHLKRFRP